MGFGACGVGLLYKHKRITLGKNGAWQTLKPDEPCFAVEIFFAKMKRSEINGDYTQIIS